ncbi:HotDog domain-containing protein [Cladochytrium replicatum]|nr:HotDog domain-containing protein [Cladochytrium replicatum]
MDRVWKAFKAILACRRSFNTFITDSLRIVDASSTEGKAVFEFTVLPDHSNAYGTIHGGIIASLVDICSAGAVIALADTPFGASIDMSTTYISAAKEGETVRIESICHKAGRTLAFTSTELYVGNKLISKGTHTKLNTAPH